MHILVLADGLFPFVVGGMQRHSSYVVRYLLQRGHRVTLGHFVPPGHSLPLLSEVKKAVSAADDAALEQVCIRFPQMGSMPGHYLRESYMCSKKLYELLQHKLSEIDVIYSKGFMAWYFLERKKGGKVNLPPVCVKFHGYEMFQPHAGWREWLRKQMLKSPVAWNTREADYVFSYGGRISDIIRSIGVPENRICEVPSGIEGSWCVDRPAIHDGPVRFLFIGRFERRKGVAELNKALRLLSEKAGWSMAFVGPVPIAKRVIDPAVTYHGQITDTKKMWEIMDQCDVLVVPSWSEGMPNVILEGMARGLAVVATDVGAVSILVNQQCGWLINQPNASLIHEQLAAIIDGGHDLILEKRVHALTRVSTHFQWETVSARLEEILLRIKETND